MRFVFIGYISVKLLLYKHSFSMFKSFRLFISSSFVCRKMAQAQASSLYNLTSRDNLDAYIQQYIQADESFLRSCQTTIDVLVSLLQNNVPAGLRPSSVRKVISDIQL